MILMCIILLGRPWQGGEATLRSGCDREAEAPRGDEGAENEEAWRRGGRAGRAGASPTTPSLTAALLWRSRRGPVGSGRIRWDTARMRRIWKEGDRGVEYDG